MFSAGDIVELVPLGDMDPRRRREMLDQESVAEHLRRLLPDSNGLFEVEVGVPTDDPFSCIKIKDAKRWCQGRFRLASPERPYDPSQEPDDEDDV